MYCHDFLIVSAARLVEGPSVEQGLVQMYYNRTWGWVCAEQWDKQDADVVCKELGYTGSSTIYNGSTGGQGNDTLFMNNIHCTGNESSLVSCARGGWTHLGCRFGQIAGAVCTGQEGTNYFMNQITFQNINQIQYHNNPIFPMY